MSPIWNATVNFWQLVSVSLKADHTGLCTPTLTECGALLLRHSILLFSIQPCTPASNSAATCRLQFRSILDELFKRINYSTGHYMLRSLCAAKLSNSKVQWWEGLNVEGVENNLKLILYGYACSVDKLGDYTIITWLHNCKHQNDDNNNS